jgi:hypothetical protein
MPEIRCQKQSVVNYQKMNSCPFHFLKCLNEFRPHNPFVMAIVCHWHAVIAIGQCAPPMQVAARDGRRNMMECIGNMMRQRAILHVDGAVIGILKFLRKLGSGNRVIRRMAMRPEKRQIFLRNANPVTHRQQSRLELLNCRYRSWVAELIHKRDSFKQTIRMILKKFHKGFERRNFWWVCALSLKFNGFGFGRLDNIAPRNRVRFINGFDKYLLIGSVNRFLTVFGSGANQQWRRYASVNRTPQCCGWQCQSDYAAQSGKHDADKVIPQ